MRYIVLLFLVFLSTTCFSQNNEVEVIVNNKFNTGVVIYVYPEIPNYYFIFEAKSYLKLLKKKNKSFKEEFNSNTEFTDTLLKASQMNITFISQELSKSNISNCIIGKLFKRKKVLVYDKSLKTELNYRFKLNRNLLLFNFKIIKSYIVFNEQHEPIFGCSCDKFTQVIVN